MRFLRLFLLALLPVFAAAQTVQFKSSNVAISGGTVQGITTLGARSSGAAFDLQIGSSEVLTASRLLKFNVADAARTITVPGTTTLPIVSQTLTISGPTAARTITVPDASFTAARTDAANTFTGTQAFSAVTATSAATTDTADADTKLMSIRNLSTGTSAVATLQLGNNGSASAGYLQVYGGSHATLPAVIDLNNRNNAAVRILSNNALVGNFTSSGLDVTGRVGATTQYNVNGVLHVSATAPSVTGFGSSPSVPNNNGTSAFTINVGTGGTANTGSVTLPAAATGWVCTAQDVTTPASFVTAQTGGTTTTATFANYSRTTGLITAWTASDVLRVSCFAY